MQGKRILVGITGSIAAYKAAILIRLLIKEGAEVKVIMTPFAKEFISPLTIATLSKNPILVDFYNPENGDWNSHIDLGLWADCFIIAPATANTLSKMAYGIADNLLLTTYLSARCPVFFAPAMDMDMFIHQATQKSIEILQSRGNICIDPAAGELASGLEGKGRMEEPENIIQFLANYFSGDSSFKGKKILITAGPTIEAIDPVRFISNHSTGKMGFSIAEEASKRGADVTLITGPVNLSLKSSSITRIDIVSAVDMYHEVIRYFNNSDIIILSAAIADYTPEFQSYSKVKKEANLLNLKLKKTIDIAEETGKNKKKGQITVGFALETDNEIENAKRKLIKKNFDFIVLNSLSDKGAGFAYNTNKVCFIDKNNNITEFELKSKQEVAIDILNKIKSFF